MRENVQGKTKIQKLLVSKLLRIDHRLFHNLNKLCIEQPSSVYLQDVHKCNKGVACGF